MELTALRKKSESQLSKYIREKERKKDGRLETAVYHIFKEG